MVMLSHLKTILGAIALMISIGGLAGEAKAQEFAFDVEVGGDTYAVYTYIGTFSEFASFQGVSTTSDAGYTDFLPWWGSKSQADLFIDNFINAWGPIPPVPDYYDPSVAPFESSGEQRIRFGYQFSGSGIDNSDLQTCGPCFGSVYLLQRNPSYYADLETNNLVWGWAYATLVPEIDGGALSQAAFVLLAFGMFLAARRRSGNMA
jgi:hypothetical protein